MDRAYGITDKYSEAPSQEKPPFYYNVRKPVEQMNAIRQLFRFGNTLDFIRRVSRQPWSFIRQALGTDTVVHKLAETMTSCQQIADELDMSVKEVEMIIRGESQPKPVEKHKRKRRYFPVYKQGDPAPKEECEQLRYRMCTCGLSIMELSERSGVPVPTLCRYVSGRGRTLKTKNHQLLVSFFGGNNDTLRCG